MENQVEIKKFRLQNQLKELDSINQYLEELADLWELSLPFIMTLNLVLEEAFTNIVNYGFPDDEKHEIELIFEKQNNQLIISLIDDGVPYDPTLTRTPDLNLPAEEREIGGLGVFLIRKMMDKVSYQRLEGHNIFKMEKMIS